MKLIIGLGAQFVLKTENGMSTAGHGNAHRVKRTTFAIEPDNGIPTPWNCSTG